MKTAVVVVLAAVAEQTTTAVAIDKKVKLKLPQYSI